jgi:hypothetical protein
VTAGARVPAFAPSFSRITRPHSERLDRSREAGSHTGPELFETEPIIGSVFNVNEMIAFLGKTEINGVFYNSGTFFLFQIELLEYTDRMAS